MDKNTLLWKVLGTGGAILAGSLAMKAVDQIWERSGHTRLDPNNPDEPLRTALLYAAATGLAVGLARVLVTRKAAQVYARSTGELPKDLQA